MLRYVTLRNIDAYDEAEAAPAGQIATLDTDETAAVDAVVARRVDQDGREPKSWDDNELDLHETYQGDWHLHGRFDPVTGAELDAALDAEAEVIFKHGGTDGQGPHPGSTPGHGADGPHPPQPRPRPGRHPGPTNRLDHHHPRRPLDAPGQGTDRHRRTHLAETVRRLACDANIFRVVTDGASESSTSAAAPAPPHPTSAEPWSSATETVCSPAATGHPATADPTTSSGGTATTARPHCRTWPCSATTTITSSTKAAGTSPEPPTAPPVPRPDGTPFQLRRPAA